MTDFIYLEYAKNEGFYSFIQKSSLFVSMWDIKAQLFKQRDLKMKLSLLFFIFSCLSTAQSLNGVWSTDCLNGNKKIQVIKEPMIYTFEIFHKDADCKTRQFYFLNVGHFTKTTSSMDFQFDAVYLNVSDANIIESFNRQSMCNQSHWKQSQNKEITGQWCLFFSPNKKSLVPNKGDFRFGIYKLENQMLYFGKIDKEHNALRPETRPIEFDPRGYKKI